MKSYLRLFLISISWTFILNVAQADQESMEPWGISPNLMKNIRNAGERSVWKIVSFDADGNEINAGTAFAINADQVVTAFSVIEQSPHIGKMVLRQGDEELNIAEVTRVSVVDNIAILKPNKKGRLNYAHITNRKIHDYRNRVVIFGFLGGVKWTLIDQVNYLSSDSLSWSNSNYGIVVGMHDLEDLRGAPVFSKPAGAGEYPLAGIISNSNGNILDFIAISKVYQLKNGSIGIDCYPFQSCLEKAIKNLEEIAEKGDSRAQYQLAQRLFKGRGVDQDNERALSWMEKAAKKNDLARYELIQRLFEGRGVDKDNERALSWMKKMKKTRFLDVLTQKYSEGRKVKKIQDLDWLSGPVHSKQYAEVIGWLSKMSNNYAKVLMSILVEKGYVPNQLGVAQLGVAQLGVAQLGVAQLEVNQSEVDRLRVSQSSNIEKSLNWLAKTMIKTHQSAEALDLMFIFAKEGIPKAISLIENMAEQNVLIQNNLAQMYAEGIGVTKNQEKALDLLSRSARQGNAKARQILESTYYQSQPFLNWLDSSSTSTCRQSFN